MSHCVTNHLGSYCFTSIDLQGLKLVRCKKTTKKKSANKNIWPTKTFALQYIYTYLHVRGLSQKDADIFYNTRLCIRNSMIFIMVFLYTSHQHFAKDLGGITVKITKLRNFTRLCAGMCGAGRYFWNKIHLDQILVYILLKFRNVLPPQ